jgi:hypothetical protein
MFFDQRSFFSTKGSRLMKHLVRDADLADVMQRRGHPKFFHLC